MSGLSRPIHKMPGYVRQALEARGLMEAYRGRPAYQRNDYIGWISRAKQEATRLKRLNQMLDELESGDAYMKMPYGPGKRSRSGVIAAPGANPVDEYLEGVPPPQRAALEKLRGQIRSAAPRASETVSYRVPTFKLHGPLVAFAAFRNHLSFYVMSPSVLDSFREEIGDFETAKGTIRFTPDRPLPAALVRKMVRARIEENEAGSKS